MWIWSKEREELAVSLPGGGKKGSLSVPNPLVSPAPAGSARFIQDIQWPKKKLWSFRAS
jgi:hypothetical protein